jgi:radical SAM-linked protein
LFSEGFNPRPKLHLSPALPLGFTSSCELADVWVQEDFPIEELRQKLQNAAPPGLRIQDVQQILEREPALQNQIIAATYEVRLDPEPVPDALQVVVKKLLARASALRERRGKRYDLRPLIEELELIHDANSQAQLRMQLAAREGATGRPDEVLLELGFNPDRAHIHRSGFIFDGETTS